MDEGGGGGGHGGQGQCLLGPGLDVDNRLVLYPKEVVVELELPGEPILPLVQNWEALAACKRS